MEFRTRVKLKESPFRLSIHDSIMCVGSCFAGRIGGKLTENRFRAMVNPFGVMYNPVSIRHTLEKIRAGNDVKTRKSPPADALIITLGTNRAYMLKETGEIVDNCAKRPQRLFEDEELSVERCAEEIRKAVDPDRQRIILTVSPIRYAKYGFHGSRLAKATLLIAADILVKSDPERIAYFPAYEIMDDELRDYRFYDADMIHPSEQAVDYIWERFAESFLDDEARQWLKDYEPIKKARGHRPFNERSDDYLRFVRETARREKQLFEKYELFPDGDDIAKKKDNFAIQ